jgi:hypothetical protein
MRQHQGIGTAAGEKKTDATKIIIIFPLGTF